MRHFSRREFIKLTAQCAGYACSAAAFGNLGNNFVYAQAAGANKKSIVLINFFGGFDGLSLVVPYTNQLYYDRRPTIAVPSAQVLQLNSTVGLHPSFSALYANVNLSGNMAVIQKVGYPNANHSHFESQDIWSRGRRNGNATDSRGWIGRLADLYYGSNYDVVGIGVSQRPDFETNRAEVQPLLLSSLKSFGYSNDNKGGNDTALRSEVAETNVNGGGDAFSLTGKVRDAEREMFAASQQLKQIDADYKSSTTYPTTGLGPSLKEIAKVIGSNIGSQIFYTGVGGWDTHANQSTTLTNNFAGVSASVDAFVKDLQAMGKYQDTCIVFFSEFGRNTFENGTNGTDHGAGNSMIVLGGSVKGGVFGSTPSAADFKKDDIIYEIDFRSVFKTVISQHLGLNPDPIFDELITDISLPIF